VTGTIRVAVVGGSGYTGGELRALLARHPRVKVEGIHARTFRVEDLGARRPDCVFLATPNEVSASLAPAILEGGAAVIDLSGAFRLRRSEDYPAWYGFAHPRPALLREAAYGLTEWSAGSLAGQRLVANPGCYATAALLALKPILPVLDPAQPIVCDGKSGVSGAGRKSDAAYSFAELSGNTWAYGASGHRHEPEIRQQGPIPEGIPLVFVPHVLPIVRGLMTTLYVAFDRVMDARGIGALYETAYAGAPLVGVLPAGTFPDIRSVAGTPRAAIGFALRPDGRRAVLVSVIDNLLKGAASQAVQNFNRVFDLDAMAGIA
jgi:N-acetyl-gamma-glutamyl-phosphate reductase